MTVESTASYASAADPNRRKIARGSYLVTSFNCSRPFDRPTRISIAKAEQLVRGDATAFRNLTDGKRVCRIFAADDTMSALHALIVQDTDSIFRVWDCGSKNGTTLGGTRVAEPTGLVDGDLIATGCTFFLFRTSQDCFLDEPFDVESPRGILATINPAFGRAVDKLDVIARTDLPVLIEGPPSSGRSSAAEALHPVCQRELRHSVRFN